MTIQEKLSEYHDEMLTHFRALLQIESLRAEPLPGMPFGEGPAKALDYMLRLSESFGLKTVNLDNFIGYTEYGDGEEYVCSISHLDVVPVGEGWKFPPFSATEEDGWIYSRGAGDNKPGNIIGLYILRCMKELGYQPKRRIRILYGCAEETGMEDVARYLESEPLPYFGITPDSECHDIINGEKGRLEFSFVETVPADFPFTSIEGGLAVNVVMPKLTAVLDAKRLTEAEKARLLAAAKEDILLEVAGDTITVTCVGISAHAAHPETGRNAAAIFAKLCKDVFEDKAIALTKFIDEKIGFTFDGKLLGIDCTDDCTGPLTFNMGMLSLNAPKLEVIIDIRYPTTADANLLMQRIAEAAQASGVEAVFAPDADSPGYQLPDHPMLGALADACVAAGAPKPKIYAIGGGTYARKFKGRMVAFGGCGESIHAPNERVKISDFFFHADILSRALENMSR